MTAIELAGKALQWRIGGVTVTRLVELEAPGLSFVLPDAVPENLKAVPWLAPHFVDAEWEAIASIQAFMVESRGKRIVVDTCVGNDKQLPLRRWTNRKGPFLEDLASAGFNRETIDTVLCTHLHMDHVGWNTMWAEGKWVATFPHARYLFGRIEWEYWNRTEESRVGTVIEQSIQPILAAGLHTLVETDHQITDEVWLEPTPGHTPGHVSVRIASKGEEGVITGDLMHHPCQIARPHWNSVADVDPEQATITRRDFITRYAQRSDLVIGTHFPAPTAGRIVRDGENFRFQVS
ncbi:MAG TPA: MBL fold metallo-hydrolase [Candidatus Angelobacter sp.]|nr:MBL fold metallo-hydrolase [Candidatus Angelobacter sp.]